MSPEDVPAEMVERFDQAAYEHATSQPPSGAGWVNDSLAAEAHYARGGIAAIWPEIEAKVRAQVAAEQRRAAAGRRHYADSYPKGHALRTVLETEADTFDKAARISEGNDRQLMCGLLPVFMWGDAEHQNEGSAL